MVSALHTGTLSYIYIYMFACSLCYLYLIVLTFCLLAAFLLVAFLFSLFVCCFAFFSVFSVERLEGRAVKGPQLTPHGESVCSPFPLPLPLRCQTQTCLCCFIIENLHTSRRSLGRARRFCELWSSSTTKLAQFGAATNCNATRIPGGAVGPQFTWPLTHLYESESESQ